MKNIFDVEAYEPVKIIKLNAYEVHLINYIIKKTMRLVENQEYFGKVYNKLRMGTMENI